MPQACKACSSPSREFIDNQLLSHVPARVIIEELGRRGESFSQTNISNHRKHVEVEDPYQDALEQIIRELQQQMRMSTPTLAAAYLVLLKQLEAFKSVKPTTENIVKTAEAITRLGGLKTQQELLLAYADRAFSPERVAEAQARAAEQAQQRLPSPPPLLPSEREDGWDL